jgi:hypothetical protein
MMNPIMKNRAEAPFQSDRPPPSRRHRAAASDSNVEFLRAFADALRDILRDERGHVPG